MAVLQLSAKAFEHMQRLFHRRAHVLGGREILLPVVAQHTDSESLHILPQRRTVIWNVALDTASIAGIKASDGLHDKSAIFDGAGERPAMVEGRHQASHTAQRGRPANRAASIGAKRHWHQSG